MRAPSLVLGFVADDYTGASDLANTLARNGLATVQTIGLPEASLALSGVEAVVIALKIRSAPVADAVAAARQAAAWLRGRGARHVMSKICSTFDSTDAGNIGPVMDALRADVDARAATLVTPAFPETGRTVYLGHLFVGSVPLDESPLKDHPLNPMHDANLVRVLARQTATRIGLLALPAIAGGLETARAALARLGQEGCGAAVADAVAEGDLEILGRLALASPVSVGASGLGLGLARAVADGRARPSVAAGPVGGYSAGVAGSCSRATLDQIAAAQATIPVLRLDPQTLATAPDGEIARALEFARARLAAGPVLIAASAEPEAVRAVQARFGREASGHAIEQATARIAEGLVGMGVRRLALAGGETSGAAVDRLGLKAFHVEEEIAAGVPILRTASGEALRLALKSGNFGGPDFFAKAFGMMR